MGNYPVRYVVYSSKPTLSWTLLLFGRLFRHLHFINWRNGCIDRPIFRAILRTTLPSTRSTLVNAMRHLPIVRLFLIYADRTPLSRMRKHFCSRQIPITITPDSWHLGAL